MTIHDLLIEPFEKYAFMRRALAVCVLLALSGTPLGVFMSLRRLALVGDSMSHAILPGVSMAFLVYGIAVWPMTIGGLIAGMAVALAALLLTRYTQLKEDSSFTVVYLLSIASGVVLVSLKGTGLDLMHLLFGNILAIDNNALYLVTGICCVTLLALAAFYRGMVITGFDPDFMKAATKGRDVTDIVFFILLVLNLVAAFQALGTLMALGLILLPAIAARFWTQSTDTSIPCSIALALLASFAGLLFSYHANIPSGPAVVLAAGIVCLVSIGVGRYGSLYRYVLSKS
jgi:zinc/manganese transport system permease protein